MHETYPPAMAKRRIRTDEEIRAAFADYKESEASDEYLGASDEESEVGDGESEVSEEELAQFRFPRKRQRRRQVSSPS